MHDIGSSRNDIYYKGEPETSFVRQKRNGSYDGVQVYESQAIPDRRKQDRSRQGSFMANSTDSGIYQRSKKGSADNSISSSSQGYYENHYQGRPRKTSLESLNKAPSFDDSVYYPDGQSYQRSRVASDQVEFIERPRTRNGSATDHQDSSERPRTRKSSWSDQQEITERPPQRNGSESDQFESRSRQGSATEQQDFYDRTRARNGSSDFEGFDRRNEYSRPRPQYLDESRRPHPQRRGSQKSVQSVTRSRSVVNDDPFLPNAESLRNYPKPNRPSNISQFPSRSDYPIFGDDNESIPFASSPQFLGFNRRASQELASLYQDGAPIRSASRQGSRSKTPIATNKVSSDVPVRSKTPIATQSKGMLQSVLDKFSALKQ